MGYHQCLLSQCILPIKLVEMYFRLHLGYKVLNVYGHFEKIPIEFGINMSNVELPVKMTSIRWLNVKFESQRDV